MKISTQTRLLTVLITSALTACSSGDGSDSDNTSTVNTTEAGSSIVNSTVDDRPGMIITGLDGRAPESVNTPWLVNFATFRDESRSPSGYAFATLKGYGDSLNMLDVIDFYEQSEPRIGDCEILVDNSPTVGGGGNNNGNEAPPSLGGGERLFINTSLGQWIALESDGALEPTYETTDGLPGAIPENAYLTIPGGTRFPAVEAYPVNEPEAPIRISPEQTEWTNADAIFSWLPGNNPAETMKLDFFGYNSLGDTFIERVATCVAVDDGNFELTTAMVQLINNYDGLIDLRYGRRATRVDLIGDIVIHQGTTVTE